MHECATVAFAPREFAEFRFRAAERDLKNPEQAEREDEDQRDHPREQMRILKLVPGRIRSAVPLSVEVASKTGELFGVHCEVAIVLHPKRPFAVGIFGSFLGDGENPVGEAARVVYEHFDRLASANAYGNRGVK